MVFIYIAKIPVIEIFYWELFFSSLRWEVSCTLKYDIYLAYSYTHCLRQTDPFNEYLKPAASRGEKTTRIRYLIKPSIVDSKKCQTVLPRVLHPLILHLMIKRRMV